MATITLRPSTTVLSNTSYTNITNAGNIWDGSNSTYATFNHTRASTTTYYLYVRGFNFSSIPSGAVVSSAVITVVASVASASTSQKPALFNNTTSATSLGTFSTAIGSSTTTSTVTLNGDNFNTFKDYGNNATVRLYLNRSNRNTASSMKVYEVYITVTYTLPVYYDVTTSLTGKGTVTPSGTTQVIEGDDLTIKIEPTNYSDTVTATDNGSVVTLTEHRGADMTVNCVTSNYTRTGKYSISNETNISGVVGYGTGDGYTPSGNAYSQSSNTYASFEYVFNTSVVPSNVTEVTVSCYVKAAPESTSNTSERLSLQLYANGSAVSDSYDFSYSGSTTLTTQAIVEDLTLTKSQLDNLKLQGSIGYYGGKIAGITLKVTYSSGSGDQVYYTYTLSNVTANHVVAIVIGSTPTGTGLKMKVNGSWVSVAEVWKKVNGTWVKQAVDDIPSLFNTTTKYIKKN